jgi:hypothetical protein
VKCSAPCRGRTRVESNAHATPLSQPRSSRRVASEVRASLHERKRAAHALPGATGRSAECGDSTTARPRTFWITERAFTPARSGSGIGSRDSFAGMPWRHRYARRDEDCVVSPGRRVTGRGGSNRFFKVVSNDNYPERQFEGSRACGNHASRARRGRYLER